MLRMDLVAAIPLLAMSTFRIGRFPPRSWTYSSNVLVTAVDEMSMVGFSSNVEKRAVDLDVNVDVTPFVRGWTTALLVKNAAGAAIHKQKRELTKHKVQYAG